MTSQGGLAALHKAKGKKKPRFHSWNPGLFSTWCGGARSSLRMRTAIDKRCQSV